MNAIISLSPDIKTSFEVVVVS